MDLHSKERVDETGEQKISGDRTYRTGIYSSADSKIVLEAARNFIEVGGNPVIQTAISVDGNATADIIADNGNNTVYVNNAVLGSSGLLVVKSDIYSKASSPETILNLTSSEGDNLIQMQGDSADIAVVENSEVLKATNDYANKFGSATLYVREEGSTATLTARNNHLLHTIPTETGEFRHYGVYVEDKGKATLIAQEINQVSGADTGA